MVVRQQAKQRRATSRAGVEKSKVYAAFLLFLCVLVCGCFGLPTDISRDGKEASVDTIAANTEDDELIAFTIDGTIYSLGNNKL